MNENVKRNVSISPIDMKSFRHAFPSTDTLRAQKMINNLTRNLFGNFDPEERIAGSCVATCIENKKGKPIAYITLNNYPWIMSVPPWDWEFWLHKLYGQKTAMAWNTFWISMMVWDEPYTNVFLQPMLLKIFESIPKTQFIFLIIPPYVKNIDWIEKQGTRIYPKNVTTLNCLTIIMFVSDQILPRYKIRKAVEEDNDEIIRLIANSSGKLSELYGEYYVAELLTTYANYGRKIIVAEHNGVVIAVLIINKNVNLDIIKKNFEVTTFFNFRKYPPDEVEYLFDMGEDVPESVEEYEDYELGLEPEPEPETESVSYESDLNEDSTESFQQLMPDYNESFKKFSFPSYTDLHPVDSNISTENSVFSIENIRSLHGTIVGEVGGHEEQKKGRRRVLLKLRYFKHLFDENFYLKSEDDENKEEPTEPMKVHKDRRSKLDYLVGEPNAFAIEIATGTEEHALSALPKLLRAAFECFPDRQFAIFSMSSLCTVQPIVRRFVHIVPKPQNTFEHHIYVLHGDTINTKTSVRKAKLSDYEAIEKGSRGMKIRQSFLEDFTTSVFSDDTDLESYVLVVGSEKIVAVVILQPVYNFSEIQNLYLFGNSYNEKVQKPYTFGRILYAVRSPVYSKLSLFFFREVYRLSDYTMLFYQLNMDDTDDTKRKRIINNFIEIMVPARVKKRSELVNMTMTLDEIKFLQRKELALLRQPSCIEYVANKKIIGRPRYHLDLKIVVVGSGNTALAFLEALLCYWSEECCLTYSNLTVVSPHGLAVQREDQDSYMNQLVNLMFPVKSLFPKRWAHIITIRALVNQVYGFMTAIDRKSKVIIIDGTTSLRYDLLFLFCGEQFQSPKLNPKNILQINRDPFPSNVFIINTETDAETAIRKIQNFYENYENGGMEEEAEEFTVLVYGTVLEAYCCLTALLEMGIPGPNLIFVDPPAELTSLQLLSYNPRPIPESEILEAVQKTMKRTGINMCFNYKYASWDYDIETNIVTGATFKSKYDQVYKKFNAMFMYLHKSVNPKTFNAINKAGLIFDGGLVIDSDGKTNDSCIYASGTFTKYSRRYYADHLAHRYFNLEEVGYKMGKKINTMFLDMATKKRVTEEFFGPVCTKLESVVKSYKRPLNTYCKFPGNLHYIHVTKPGKFVSSDITEASGEYGKDLITGKISDMGKQGFFKIHLNNHGFIESITCLSLDKLDVVNIFSMYGKHERYFNNLQLRYEMGLITDFYDYFRQSWTFALYQDDFPELMNKIRNTFYRNIDSQLGKSLGQVVTKLHREHKWKEIPAKAMVKMEKQFENSEYPEQVKELIIRYISEREHALPMYLMPAKDFHLFFDGNESSPLFNPQ